MNIQRRGLIRIISFLCAIITIMAGLCIYVNHQKNSFIRAVDNEYKAAFNDLSSHMYNIETAFYKLLYSNSDYQLIKCATKVWGEALSAKTNIENLYGYSSRLMEVSEFLSKSGDYIYYTALKRIRNEELTESDYNTLSKLAQSASALTSSITEISNKLNSGVISYDEITVNVIDGDTFEDSDNSLSGDLVSSVEQISSYPELIYDGPFSDHIEKQESVYLKDKPEITKDEAENRLKTWIPNIENLDFKYESGSKIPAYVFGNEEYTVAISKQNGNLIELVCQTNYNKSKISIDDALEVAEDFLELIGHNSMEENYYYTVNNEITINYSFEQDDVIIYPDMVKVTVSLENGAITGFEGYGYLMSHKDVRDISVKLSENEAENKINQSLNVIDSRLAVIPTDGKNEVLCYEFYTHSKDGRTVLVYINANTGVEEMLQILIENEYGTLVQ